MASQHNPRGQGNHTVSSEGKTPFFTNHAHVLACLARGPETTLRTVAGELQLTERAVQRIVADLEKEGILSKNRVGRCNQYRISKSKLLGHPLEKRRTIAEFLEFTDS